ncbi:histidinol-phosphatase [candidate division WWE3 bacterium]|jgi:imidazoleglycerol-phosphate dehydratase/histidinol-phosphatase|uniref:D,D-heptose 1,7-bisphosphate phosphatase n=1 Tax=candidate division WWE3 bacterium TaxID=2053526 RepID=A0A3A4ZD86_UNCKA|nr:MAG: histidinol-phosphatase [candidate division WWE3 bacterium]
MGKKKVLFLDRDGTLIREPENGVIDKLSDFRLLPDVIESLGKLKFAGYTFVIVSNQPGLGKGRINPEGFYEVHKEMLKLFAMDKIFFDEVLFCPHNEEENCECRKPKTGLLTEYLRNNDIDMERSFVIGDRHTDIELAKNLGVKSVRVSAENDSDAYFTSNSWKEIVRYILDYQF